MAEESRSRNWIDEFFEMLRPERERCVLARRRGQKPWKEDRWLSRQLVECQQEKGLMLAYFAREGGRDWVAVDVDDHDDGGWIGGVPTQKLRTKAAEVVKRIGNPPSIAFATPRGVHVYWFLNRVVPEDVIVRSMGKRVDGIAEHRPTVKDALRVPDAARCVDAELQPVAFEGFAAVKRWNPEDVLGAGCEMRPRTIEDLRSRHRNVVEQVDVRGAIRSDQVQDAREPEAGKRTGGSVGKEKMARIEAEENAVGPLKNHRTNQAYAHLVGVYYANGLSQEEAKARFVALIDGSPRYSGPLRTELERRIASSYQNLKPIVSEVHLAWKALREDSNAKAVVKSIIDAVGLSERSKGRESLEKVIWGLWKRKLQNDWIVEDPMRLEAHERKHPGYKTLREEGFYPVSSQELQDLVHRYRTYVAMLIGVGVMAPSPRRYKPGLRCQHYALRINAFKVLRGHSVALAGSLTVTRVGVGA